MKNLLPRILGLLLLISCRPPNLVDINPHNPETPTKCVGGGCSVDFKITITADGRFERDPNFEKFRDPTLDQPKDSDSFVGWIKRVFTSPTSLPNPDYTPSTSPTSPAGDHDSDGTVDPGTRPTPGENGPLNQDPDPTYGSEEPKPAHFENSELGKLLSGVGSGSKYAWDEISGANKKKRREAQQVNRKIAEALVIKDKIELLLDEMNRDSASIVETAKQLSDETRYTPSDTSFSKTKDFAEAHNVRLDKVFADTQDLSDQVAVPPAVPLNDTPDLRSIEQARQYAKYASRKVEELPTGPREAGRALVAMGNQALDTAETAYRTGNKEQGDFAKEIGISCLDAALGFVPGVGLAKDAYEAISGTRLLTGEKLTPFERTFAVAGVLTAGYGSKVAIAGKAGLILDIFKAGSKDAEAVKDITKAVSGAEEFVESAASLKRFGPLEKGPLHEIPAGSGTVAETFRSSSYYEVVTKEETKLYRVYTAGDESKKLSPYWSRIKPDGPLQAQLDSALIPDFGNKATAWIEMKVPPGTKFYEGVASEMAIPTSANGKIGQLYGGGSQIYFTERVDSKWLGASGVFNAF